MNNKKTAVNTVLTTFFLLILLLTITFLFTGCDEMLEALFPEFADGNNTIDVYIESPVIPSSTQPIVVALIPYDASGTSVRAGVVSVAEATDAFYATFDGIGSGTFKVFAWQDLDNDGYFDFAGVTDENEGYNGLAETSAGDSVFTFNSESGTDFIEAECTLTAGDSSDLQIQNALGP